MSNDEQAIEAELRALVDEALTNWPYEVSPLLRAVLEQLVSKTYERAWERARRKYQVKIDMGIIHD